MLPAQEIRQSGKLRTVTCGVVVKLKDGNSVEFHVERDSEGFCSVPCGSAMPSRDCVIPASLFGGRATKYSFLHSFGSVTCAGR